MDFILVFVSAIFLKIGAILEAAIIAIHNLSMSTEGDNTTLYITPTNPDPSYPYNLYSQQAKKTTETQHQNMSMELPTYGKQESFC